MVKVLVQSAVRAGGIPAQGQLFAAFYQQQGQRQNRQQVAPLQAEDRLCS